MNLQHVNAKIFVDGELSVDLERFIVVFHDWVAQQSMNEMMIDVADYRHVPAGPGVVMVGLESDYAIDNMGGRFGLRYNRKGELEGSNQQRILHALRQAANVCGLLEEQFDGLKFSRQEFEVFVNDRALAPNTPETRALLQAEIASLVNEQLGQEDFEAEFHEDPRQLAGAVVSLPAPVQFGTFAATGPS